PHEWHATSVILGHPARRRAARLGSLASSRQTTHGCVCGALTNRPTATIQPRAPRAPGSSIYPQRHPTTLVARRARRADAPPAPARSPGRRVARRRLTKPDIAEFV